MDILEYYTINHNLTLPAEQGADQGSEVEERLLEQ